MPKLSKKHHCWPPKQQNNKNTAHIHPTPRKPAPPPTPTPTPAPPPPPTPIPTPPPTPTPAPPPTSTPAPSPTLPQPTPSTLYFTAVTYHKRIIPLHTPPTKTTTPTNLPINQENSPHLYRPHQKLLLTVTPSPLQISFTTPRVGRFDLHPDNYILIQYRTTHPTSHIYQHCYHPNTRLGHSTYLAGTTLHLSSPSPTTPSTHPTGPRPTADLFRYQ